eukprot:scaffold42434_cov60-Phaeocystis_antarctica.AAC.1
MQPPSAVQLLEPVQGLAGHEPQLIVREVAYCPPVEDECEHAALPTEPVDARLAGQAVGCLVDESLALQPTLGDVDALHLDGHLCTARLMAASVHLAEFTAAQQLADGPAGDPVAGRQKARPARHTTTAPVPDEERAREVSLARLHSTAQRLRDGAMSTSARLGESARECGTVSSKPVGIHKKRGAKLSPTHVAPPPILNSVHHPQLVCHARLRGQPCVALRHELHLAWHPLRLLLLPLTLFEADAPEEREQVRLSAGLLVHPVRVLPREQPRVERQVVCKLPCLLPPRLRQQLALRRRGDKHPFGRGQVGAWRVADHQGLLAGRAVPQHAVRVQARVRALTKRPLPWQSGGCTC